VTRKREGREKIACRKGKGDYAACDSSYGGKEKKNSVLSGKKKGEGVKSLHLSEVLSNDSEIKGSRESFEKTN